MRRQLRLIAVGAVLATVLAGCAGLPTSGPVGSEPIAAPTGPPPQSLPGGPQKGGTAVEMIEGFLRAGRAPQGGYATARDFLTDDFRSQWKPSAGVIISNSVSNPAQVDATTYSVTVSVLARVNAAGTYTELANPESETLTFDVEKNDQGEWRISNAPDGTVLSTNFFDAAFNPYLLYFFDPSGSNLVPDLRWFPDTVSTPTRIVSELLAGPAAWLSGGALVSAFPSGTQLGDAVPPVDVESGRATVDLSSEVLAQSSLAQRRMQQQLVASLKSLPDVSSVQMTVGGVPVQVSDGGAAPESTFAVSSTPLGRAGNKFGFLTGGSDVQAIPGISSKVDGLSPAGATLARDRGSAAVLNSGGVWLVSSGSAKPVLLDSRAGLATPSIDTIGIVWSAPAGNPAALTAFEANGTAHPIAGLPAGRILSLEVARDGARLLVGIHTADGDELLAYGIIRDKDLVPTGLGDPLKLPITESLVDATWVDAVTIGVLSRGASGMTVDLFQLGGPTEPYGLLSDAVAIVGGNGPDGMRVLDTHGAVRRPSVSRTWQTTGIDASFLSTQQ